MKLNLSNSSCYQVLDDSNLLFEKVFNQQFQFMAILSPEGRVLDINEFALSSQGVTREDYVGKLFWKSPAWCNFPEWEQIWKQRLEEASNQKDPVITVDTFQVKDGSTHIADASTTAIFNPDNGQLSGFIIQAIDITTRRLFENKTLESETRLNFILEHSDIGSWELNLVDGTSMRSLKHDQIFGYESLLPDWTYATFLEHVIEEDRMEVDEKFQYAIQHESNWSIECRILTKNGEIRWIWALGGHEIDANGKARVMAGIVQDVTEVKQAQIEKIQHHAELQSLFQALPDIYFRLMPDGTIIDYQAQTDDKLYIKPNEFIGKRMQDILPADVGLLFQSKIELMDKVQHTLLFNYELIINNEVIHFEARVNKIAINNQFVCVIRDVSAEFASKKSLEISEQRFRTIFEQAAVGVALINTSNGEFIRINQRLCDMLGYSEEEILNGKKFSELTHPDDLQSGLDYIEKVINNESHEVAIQKRYLHKDGYYVWAELALSSPWKVDEHPYNLIAVVQDISQRKNAEEKIKIKQKQLLQAETIGKMGSWQIDLSSFKGKWSPEIHNILGTNDIPDTGPVLIKDIIYPDDWHKVESSLNNTVALGSLCEIEYRVSKPNGDEAWLYCKAERENDDSDKPSKLVGILQDITNRKRDEEKQRLSAAVYKNTSEGVMITSDKGIIIDVNQAFCLLTGYEAQDVIGKNPHILSSGRQGKDFYKEMWKTISATGQWTGEIWNRRKDGSVYPELLNISSINDDHGNLTHYVGVFSDISKIKSSEEKLYHLAHHDALTGLPNRLLLNVFLELAIKRANRRKSLIAVIFFDLDNFKIVNDSFGHAIGDLLLQETARRLLSSVRDNDSVSRISGDEFIILLEDIHQASDVVITAEKLLNVFQKRFSLQEHHVNVTASMGICLFPQDANDSSELLRNADAAMYQAKGFGRNSYKFYTSEMTNNAFERVLLENSLRQAINNDEFYLHYQPQFELSTNTIIGLEVLIRWNHPTLGLVSPANFIPLAEETGLIIEIGEWVLRTACTQAKDWLDRGVNFGSIAVNIAGPQIKRGNIVQLVQTILIETDLPAEMLELEVTESYIMQQTDKAIEQMEEIRNLGVMLSIDDFGTGYSSLSYLKKLPINKLKIDQSFVRDIPEDPDDMAIAKAVIALGTAMGLIVIAEGVETKEQVNFLTEAGCHEAQGFLFSKPIDKVSIECFVSEYNDKLV
ncbi:PAS domain S-box protein [Shewanella donghaensis]|uniref:PAS domain S-box protein n=1 Tax=Shewanella donghaensis TaxID=238836 RepID=UPI001182BD06|nr:PAS domain S-box protein [Shewanella donghaensis]